MNLVYFALCGCVHFQQNEEKKKVNLIHLMEQNANALEKQPKQFRMRVIFGIVLEIFGIYRNSEEKRNKTLTNGNKNHFNRGKKKKNGPENKQNEIALEEDDHNAFKL